MRALIFASFVGIVLASGRGFAAPTPADTVKAAYSDYLAAQDRADVAGAEAAAERALDASEKRDGGGGSTAVLALNLALARIDADHASQAIAPARRALELAGKGGTSVDPLMARLVLGEAQLTANSKADARPLMEALRAADGRSDLDAAIYSAAVALGNASWETDRDFTQRILGWREAVAHAAGEGGDIDVVRAKALSRLAFMQYCARDEKGALQSLNAAVRLLLPLAPEQAEPGEPTPAELALADTIRTSMTTQVEENRSGWIRPKRASPPGLPPLCPGEIGPVAPVNYSEVREPRDGSAGRIVQTRSPLVLRVSTDLTGNVLSVKLLNGTPQQVKAVEVLRARLTFVPDRKQNRAACRLNSNDRLLGLNLVSRPE